MAACARNPVPRRACARRESHSLVAIAERAEGPLSNTIAALGHRWCVANRCAGRRDRGKIVLRQEFPAVVAHDRAELVLARVDDSLDEMRQRQVSVALALDAIHPFHARVVIHVNHCPLATAFPAAHVHLCQVRADHVERVASRSAIVADVAVSTALACDADRAGTQCAQTRCEPFWHALDHAKAL